MTEELEQSATKARRMKKKRNKKKLPERKESFYPTQLDITYLARVGDLTVVYMTDDPYSRKWFYPRHADGSLHEPAASRLLLEHLTSETVFIDVGAHLGYFAMLAASKAKTVFAIEVLEFLIPRIHRNCVANHFENVHTIYAGAGDKTGFVSVPKVGGPRNKVGNEQTGSLVPLIRLDDYFSKETAPMIIKIDTEGFEYQVLKGASKLLEKKPKLLIEVHRGMTAFGHTRNDLYQLLKDYDYNIHSIDHRSEDGTQAELSYEQMSTLNNVMIFCT